MSCMLEDLAVANNNLQPSCMHSFLGSGQVFKGPKHLMHKETPFPGNLHGSDGGATYLPRAALHGCGRDRCRQRHGATKTGAKKLLRLAAVAMTGSRSDDDRRTRLCKGLSPRGWRRRWAGWRGSGWKENRFGEVVVLQLCILA